MNKKEQKLEVTGMTCNHCVMAVQKAFMTLEAVESAEVNLEEKSALIIYDADKTKPENLTAVLNDTNYNASLK